MLNKILYKFYKKGYLKYRQKVLSQKEIEWQNYKEKSFGHYICGIDNSTCLEKCNNKDFWEKYGCMYLKNYKDY